jgi:hypothetical protein
MTSWLKKSLRAILVVVAGAAYKFSRIQGYFVARMESSYGEYSPRLIHTILQQYKKGVRGQGLGSLVKKYDISGGKKLISYWLSKWDGTEDSLRKQSGGDKRSILTSREKKLHIRDFVDNRSKTEAVIYSQVKDNVEKKTKKALGLSTVQRYGKDLKISSKKRKRSLKSQGLAFLFLLQVHALLFCEKSSHSFCGRDGRLS